MQHKIEIITKAFEKILSRGFSNCHVVYMQNLRIFISNNRIQLDSRFKSHCKQQPLKLMIKRSRLYWAYMRQRKYSVIVMCFTSLQRSHWQWKCKQEKGPWRCLVLGGALPGEVPLNTSIELFGLNVPNVPGEKTDLFSLQKHPLPPSKQHSNQNYYYTI